MIQLPSRHLVKIVVTSAASSVTQSRCSGHGSWKWSGTKAQQCTCWFLVIAQQIEAVRLWDSDAVYFKPSERYSGNVWPAIRIELKFRCHVALLLTMLLEDSLSTWVSVLKAQSSLTLSPVPHFNYFILPPIRVMVTFVFCPSIFSFPLSVDFWRINDHQHISALVRMYLSRRPKHMPVKHTWH